MSGNRPPASERPTALTRLPPPGRRSRPGYLWTVGLVGALLVVALVLVGADFFKVPGTDPVRAGGWYFVVALEILIPAAVVVLVLSVGVVALLRAVGARTWPGILQAAPAVAVVLGVLFLLIAWLFSGPETG